MKTMTLITHLQQKIATVDIFGVNQRFHTSVFQAMRHSKDTIQAPQIPILYVMGMIMPA